VQELRGDDCLSSAPFCVLNWRSCWPAFRMPVAATAWAAHFGWLRLRSPLSWLGGTPAVVVFIVLALVEIVYDKLPNTPKRTAPPGLFRGSLGSDLFRYAPSCPFRLLEWKGFRRAKKISSVFKRRCSRLTRHSPGFRLCMSGVSKSGPHIPCAAGTTSQHQWGVAGQRRQTEGSSAPSGPENEFGKPL
jgi:hypothetical protein